MALLNIDRNKIALTVKVGVLEEYKPDQDIAQLHEEVEQLRDKFKKSMKRIIGETENLAEAQKILQTDADKLNKWTKYIEKTYSKQLEKLQQKVVQKNKEICPNFEEQILKQR